MAGYRDLKNGIINLPSSKIRGVVCFPLTPQLRQLLEQDMTPGEPDDLVFASQRGRKLEQSKVRDAFKEAADAAGIPWLGMQIFRRTYLSSVAKTYPESVVKELAGYESVADAHQVMEAAAGVNWDGSTF